MFVCPSSRSCNGKPMPLADSITRLLWQTTGRLIRRHWKQTVLSACMNIAISSLARRTAGGLAYATFWRNKLKGNGCSSSTAT